MPVGARLWPRFGIFSFQLCTPCLECFLAINYELNVGLSHCFSSVNKRTYAVALESH